jgi:ketosteroid isomerase-like protein
MRWILVIGVALPLSLAACGSGEETAAQQAAQKQADIYAIDQIEVKWHKAASTKDVDLMMSLFAPDATATFGTTNLAGTDEIRDFFVNKVGPFQPENHWVSDTPAYKIRVTVNGDKGTLYFECDYIDVKTQKVASVVGADQTVERINGKWLITNVVGATPVLEP